jgi:hypothetical protein
MYVIQDNETLKNRDSIKLSEGTVPGLTKFEFKCSFDELYMFLNMKAFVTNEFFSDSFGKVKFQFTKQDKTIKINSIDLGDEIIDFKGFEKEYDQDLLVSDNEPDGKFTFHEVDKYTFYKLFSDQEWYWTRNPFVSDTYTVKGYYVPVKLAGHSQMFIESVVNTTGSFEIDVNFEPLTSFYNNGLKTK